MKRQYMVVLLLLSGCVPEEPVIHITNDELMCNMKGHAYYAEPIETKQGNFDIVTRAPDADGLCEWTLNHG